MVEQQFLALVDPYLIDVADGTDARRVLEQVAKIFRRHAEQSGERPQRNLFGRWCDLLELRGAEPIAWYDSNFYAGVPAVTVNKFGEGEVY